MRPVVLLVSRLLGLRPPPPSLLIFACLQRAKGHFKAMKWGPIVLCFGLRFVCGKGGGVYTTFAAKAFPLFLGLGRE